MPLKVYTKTFGAPPSFHCSKNYNLNLSAKHRDAPKKTTAKVAAVVMKIVYVLEDGYTSLGCSRSVPSTKKGFAILRILLRLCIL